jgi:hypothetical protein
MGLSRRVDVRLSDKQLELLRLFARRNGLAVGASARLLLTRGLDSSTETSRSETALAALVAAEHAVLMVASILPEGERRMRALAERACEAAAERLATLTQSPEAGR